MPTAANGMRSKVAAIVDGFLDGWYTFDAARAFADFDLAAPGFLYQPMERDRPVDDPAAYLRAVQESSVREFRELRWANIEHDVVGDCLWAYVDLVRHTVGHDGATSRGAYRASFFLVPRGEGWKVVHYHESAQPDMPRPRRVGGGHPVRPPELPPSDDTLTARARAAEARTLPHSGDPETAAVRMLEAFVIGWEALDVDFAYSWWDRDYPNHVYLALEIASPARSWDAIETYRLWQLEDRLATGTRWDWKTPLQPEDRRVQVLGEDLVLVYSNLHARGLRPHEPEPDEERTPYFTYRVSWLLRRSAGEWKVVHYHESRPTSGPTAALALGLHPSGPPGQP
ncbi:MAG: nuclear transport factor 2 family protein [Dehalococcoidia bacterium]|nr:nuclear transport factor 2 family protein [Dehalococcoidia bacterium]